MTVEDALALVNTVLAPQYLNDVQESIFRQCWLDKTYQDIAVGSGYTHDHIRWVGSQLWQSLSAVLGEKVTKSNFRAVLNRYQQHHSGQSGQDVHGDGTWPIAGPQIPSRLSAHTNISSLGSAVEQPTGPISISSPFYIERSPLEPRCYDAILTPGALIRIKASRQMGKTSLMARILHHAQNHGYQTVALSLRQASLSLFNDPERFLSWFCASVTYHLGIPNQLDDYWDDIFGGNSNSTRYFETYLLPSLEAPLVLAIDDADVVFQYPELATDFLGLLRAWYEKAKYGVGNSELWQRLRLVVIHSTEVYIPLPVRQSPFNVGLSIELPELTLAQVTDLAQRYTQIYGLPLSTKTSSSDLAPLIQYVGGHPYLLQLAFHQLVHHPLTIEQLLSDVSEQNAIYQEILRRQWQNLQQYPLLVQAYGKVVRSPHPVQLDSKLIFELQSLGLIRIEANGVRPCCQLYRDYFGDRLNSPMNHGTNPETSKDTNGCSPSETSLSSVTTSPVTPSPVTTSPMKTKSLKVDSTSDPTHSPLGKERYGKERYRRRGNDL